MFNQQRNLMKLSRFAALCSVVVLGVGICTSTGQTTGFAPQNAPRVALSNGVRASNVPADNANQPYVPRGRANIGELPSGILPAIVQSKPINLWPNYSAVSRQVNT